jgi:DNA-binding FadR family transcriptional regulator
VRPATLTDTVADAEVPVDPGVPKAAELVANQLRRQIITGKLPAGEALPSESQLQKTLGVSRPTLRAAFRILESEHLVTMRRGSRGGAWVSAPTTDVVARRAGVYLQYHGTTLDDVHRARGIIEPPAAATLAERGSPKDVAELESILADEEAAFDDRDALRVAGERFHTRLIELTGNQTLIVFSAMLQGVIDAHTARFQTAQRARGGRRVGRERHAEHERVTELIRAGAAQEAEAYWADHLESVRKILVSKGEADTVLDLMD